MAEAPAFRLGRPGFRLGNGSEGAFSGDGHWFLQKTEHHVDVWDVASRERVHRLRNLSLPWHFALSPDKTRLAMTNAQSKCSLMTVDGEVLWTRDTRSSQIAPLVQFSHDGSRVLVGVESYLCVFDATSGEMLLEHSVGDDGSVQSISVSENGRVAATFAFRKKWYQRHWTTKLMLFDDSACNRIVRSMSIALAYGSAALSRDGNHIAVVGSLRSNVEYSLLVLKFDLEETARGSMPSHPSSSSAPTWSPDGSEIAVCLRTRDIYVLDAATATVKLRIQGDGLWTFSYCPTNELIAVTASDGGVVLPREQFAAWGEYEGPIRARKMEAIMAKFGHGTGSQQDI